MASKTIAATCPACSSERAYPFNSTDPRFTQVHICERCGAVHGRCRKGDSYEIVKPRWAPADTPVEAQVYYDLEVLGSAGLERRHGWFVRDTGLITQVG